MPPRTNDAYKAGTDRGCDIWTPQSALEEALRVGFYTFQTSRADLVAERKAIERRMAGDSRRLASERAKQAREEKKAKGRG